MHHPLGGLSRKSTLLSFSRKGEVPIFFADSGDMHLKYPDMTRSETREFRLRTELFRKAHEYIGLDVQGVGDLDLAIGWPYLREAWEGSSVALVSANIYVKETGELAFRPWIVVERGGLRVAFIGLMSQSEDTRLPKEIAEQIEVRDPEEALTRAIQELDGEKPDLVVLLSHLGKDAELEIAREVPGLDVILGGHSGEILHAPLESGGVVIAQAGQRGKQVGRLDLWFNPEGEPGAEEYLDQAKAPRSEASQFPKRLAYVNRIEQMKKDLEYDDQVETWIKEYKQTIRDLPPLDEDLGEDDPEALPPVIDRYWGSETCAKCHLQQAEWWNQTTHAHAYDTLVKVKSEKRGECIACHSVGYKDPGGFEDPARVGKFMNVGCESCHGRGDHHGQLDKFNTATRLASTCQTCHNAERDTAWSESKIDQIACPSLAVAPTGVAVPPNFMKPKGRALYDPAHVPEAAMGGH